MREHLAKLIHDSEHDREEARRWFKESTDEQVFELWKTCQLEYGDPALRMMAKFAALKITELAEGRERRLTKRQRAAIEGKRDHARDLAKRIIDLDPATTAERYCLELAASLKALAEIMLEVVEPKQEDR